MSKLRSWALGAFSFLIAAVLMVSGISGWWLTDTVAAAEETEPIVYEVAGWQICLEDASRTSSLSAVSVSLGYSSVETTDLEQSAAEGYEYCLLRRTRMPYILLDKPAVRGLSFFIKWESSLNFLI